MDLEQKLIRSTANLNPETIKLITKSIEANTVFIRWGLGLCAAAFGTLMGWVFMLSRSINNQKHLSESIVSIVESVKKIETALVGNYDKKGLMTKHDELEKDVHEIKKKLNA